MVLAGREASSSGSDLARGVSVCSGSCMQLEAPVQQQRCVAKSVAPGPSARGPGSSAVYQSLSWKQSFCPVQRSSPSLLRLRSRLALLEGRRLSNRAAESGAQQCASTVPVLVTHSQAFLGPLRR